MRSFYGEQLSSPLMLGTALYPSPAVLREAFQRSGASVATVSVRREAGGHAAGADFWALIRQLGVKLLPNTAGCHSVREAVTTAQMARELFGTDWIKLEVIGHTDASTRTLVGHRFEVDEAATLAAAAGTVVIDTGSAHNTTSAAALAGLADYRVAIRPHWTLAALFGSGPASRINAARSAARGDQVLAWNGHGFSVYYLRAGATPEWRNVATGSLNQDDTVVPPGTGLFLRRRAGAWSASLVGEVRTTPFARPVFGPSQLVAGGFPTPSTPTEWKLTGGTGLTAGTTPANSDRVLAWNGSQFSEYYLRASTVPEWRNTATGLIDHARAHIFPAQGAALLILRAPATGQAPAPLVQAVPFSL